MDYVDDFLFDEIRVLLGEDGTVVNSEGKPILQYVWGKYWVNNHAHILAPSGEYSLEAIYVALKRTAINQIVTGAVQMKISQRNLKSLELEMPSSEELGYLQDLFAAYRSNQDENTKLAALRDALLPRLMSGEIDVSKVDLTQLNSHLAETLRQFGCHIPAIQKTRQPALLRAAPCPWLSRHKTNQHHSPTYQIAHPAGRDVWASPPGRNPRQPLPPDVAARRLHGAQFGTGMAI